ncbi:molybdopterin oxidoreductase [candidate division KSB3 bacterium]|uniref:Molybdopterin oxidoreductase n=1 Tax=candidate division KSB3 bacterium TaxID=2044937 RepID=A0A2G6E1Y5_9BACT|nr:MAG: molybdopterin oxidoreductase [candidate division KSB3 bacterium]PIE28790.1 MAG: molybdopterin oxidoreductase [candidate division KSB3 bacterium]
MIQTIPVSCNKDCGGDCPLLAHIHDGTLIKVTNNPAGMPYMKGCARGLMIREVLESPDRLLNPLIRTGERGEGKFREVGWDEGVAYVAQNISEIIMKFGAESIMRLGGSGSCRGALHNTGLLTARFLSLLGAYTETSGNYSSAAESFALSYIFGTKYYGIDPATLLHSQCVILWGANILDTVFGCEFPQYLREVKKQGIPIIVIDPRRTRTVEQLATRWIHVLPGTDAVLMAAVLYALLAADAVDRKFLDRYTSGFHEVEAYILGQDDGIPKTPEWAEAICHTPAHDILALAEMYGRHRPAALIPGLSIQRTVGGEESARMAVVLQAATGNIGVPGGSSGGNIWGRLPNPRCGSIDPLSTKERPAVAVYQWPDAVLEGRSGGFPSEIRLLYNVGGNFLSQGSDIRKNIRAFSKVDFVVSHDAFMTPTCQWSDVIFPVTTFLERADIIFPAGNYLLFSHQALQPPPNVKDDYEIFRLLSSALGCEERFSEGKSASQWIDDFLAESEIEDIPAFRECGIYMGDDQQRIGLAEFFRDPGAHPLSTPSGRIELAASTYAETGFPAVPKARPFQPSAKYPLCLITPHARFRVNSQNSNIEWFQKREVQELWMNPDDACKRGISPGDRVCIESAAGSMEIQAKITDYIMPGVVCLSQGQWPKLTIDDVDRAGSANILTSSEPTLPSKGSRTHSVGVTVRPL